MFDSIARSWHANVDCNCNVFKDSCDYRSPKSIVDQQKHKQPNMELSKTIHVIPWLFWFNVAANEEWQTTALALFLCPFPMGVEFTITGVWLFLFVKANGITFLSFSSPHESPGIHPCFLHCLKVFNECNIYWDKWWVRESSVLPLLMKVASRCQV